MKAGIISMLYPSEAHPYGGVFIKDELDYLSKYVSLKLLSPVNVIHWIRDSHNFTASCGYQVKRPAVVGYPRKPLRKYYPLSIALSIIACGRDFLKDSDIIHAHLGFPDGVAAGLVYRKSKPVVVTVHGTDINSLALEKDINPVMVDGLNRVDKIICVSRSLSVKVGNLGIKTPTVVIPNGIDTSIFRPAEKEEGCLKVGLDPQRPRLLFAGNFVPVKGITYLLGAMPEVLGKFPECELVLLGAAKGTDDEIKFLPEIERLGIENNVRIFHSVRHEEMVDFINASDSFVLPSIKEGFGLVAAESLACGVPVVSTVSGGPEDIVAEGMGKLVEPGNSGALAESIIEVLSGKGLKPSKEMTEYSYDNFSYDMVVKKIIDVYKSLID